MPSSRYRHCKDIKEKTALLTLSSAKTKEDGVAANDRLARRRQEDIAMGKKESDR